jgi:hypothetical protein
MGSIAGAAGTRRGRQQHLRNRTTLLHRSALTLSALTGPEQAQQIRYSITSSASTREEAEAIIEMQGEIGRQTASLAVRILAGEALGNIKTPPIALQAPDYDWRELDGWNTQRNPPAGGQRRKVKRGDGLATVLLAAVCCIHRPVPH